MSIYDCQENGTCFLHSNTIVSFSDLSFDDTTHTTAPALNEMKVMLK